MNHYTLYVTIYQYIRMLYHLHICEQSTSTKDFVIAHSYCNKK